MIDKNTFGKNKADICLAEDLQRDKNERQTKSVGKLIKLLDSKLKVLQKIDNKQGRTYFARIMQEKCYEMADGIASIKSERTRSFLRNSIKGKVNDCIKRA